MGYDFGIIKNTTDWEAFIESFNKIITAKEKAIAELAAQPKHQLTIFEINDELNIALENEHKRILNGILANSELEFEGEEGTEYIPTLAQIQEKSKETKEEVFIQHEVVTKKREEREALNCQLEEKTREIARLKEEYEKNKAELEQTKKNNKDRAAKVFFKMHKNNPVGIFHDNDNYITEVLGDKENFKTEPNSSPIKGRESFWKALNEKFGITSS